MLDKTSRAIFEYVKNDARNGSALTFVDDIVSDLGDALNMSAFDVEKAVRYLIKKNWLEYYDKDSIVTLSHQSVHWKEFKKIFTIEYLFRNWIAIIALIFSLIALFC